MSSSELKIISTIPSYIPDKIQLDDTRKFLSKMYEPDKIEFITSQTIEFIDQGENFETVSCNVCGREIDMESWQNEMDIAYQKQFTDLNFLTPCCNRQTSLNDLIYKSPAGFAKFVIRISDPNIEVSNNDLKQLEEILRTGLRIVWAHY